MPEHCEHDAPAAARPAAGAPRATPVRVGLVLDGGEEYGVLHAVRYLLQNLDPRRVTTVGIFLGHAPGRNALAPHCMEVCDLNVGCILPLSRPGRRRYEFTNIARKGWIFLRAARATAQAVARLHLDVLHANMYPMHLVAGLAARRAQVPCIWHWHGSSQFRGPLGRLARFGMTHLATHIACISRFVASTLPADLQDRCYVVYNGVEGEVIHSGQRRGQLRQRLRLPDSQPLVGLFGSIAACKGHDYFLRAAQRVHALVPDVHFAIVGDETEVSRLRYGRTRRLRHLTAELGLEDVVHFCGNIPEAPLYMSDCDVICMPTVPTGSVFGEGFGLVMAEAMAAGVPVVATHCGAPPEVIEDGISGRLIPPRQVEPLAGAMLELLADPARRQRMGQAATQRIAARFDVTHAAEAMQNLYTRCRDGGPPQGAVDHTHSQGLHP